MEKELTFWVQFFERMKTELVPSDRLPVVDEDAAVASARRSVGHFAGAVAFSADRTVATGELRNARVLISFGEVPTDWSPVPGAG